MILGVDLPLAIVEEERLVAVRMHLKPDTFSIRVRLIDDAVLADSLLRAVREEDLMAAVRVLYLKLATEESLETSLK